MRKTVSIIMLALAAGSLSAQSGSQAFTTSGMFTVPSGVTSIFIEVVGAGGAGGGNGGGGGGGGGYAAGVYAVTPLSTLNVTIGAAGGGAGSGTTLVGALISATGGGNGTSVANPNIGGGGTGGAGVSGSLVNRVGGNGGGGYWTYFGGGGGGAAGALANGNNGGNTIAWTGVCQTPGGTGGISGGAPGGDGGKGAGFTDANCNVTNPSGNGNNYGGGGGGANGNGGGAGTGNAGYANISWGSTGIANQPQLTSLLVYPNPFSGKLSVQNTVGNENYELYNLVGQNVWSGKHIEQADFTELPSGLYFLKVIQPATTQTIKLIKK